MTESNGGSKAYDVAVIGCGLMGAALARAFAKSGRSVAGLEPHSRAGRSACRRRHHARAIDRRRRPVDATRRRPPYDLRNHAHCARPVANFDGTTLVNFASGSPEEVAEQQKWAANRSAEYLDGSLVCYPQDIGSPDATILYSGSYAAWTEHEQALMCLASASAYVAEQVTAASVLNVGLVGAFFVSALSAYVEAATYVLDQGVSPEALVGPTRATLEAIRQSTEEVAMAIVSDHHETDRATIATHAEATGAALTAMRAAGQRARLLDAATQNLQEASAAGLGSLGFSAQSKVAAADPVETVVT
jgi:3-hydroxyisobutyrate dehydrogenase-like beta-hydroxyacid dehydrogenase